MICADAGAVLIYTIIAGFWSQLQVITPAFPSYSGDFGCSVAFNGVDDTFAVGGIVHVCVDVCMFIQSIIYYDVY